MKASAKKAVDPAQSSAAERIPLEDQVRKRAWALWYRKGLARGNAFAAWSQAEHEMGRQNSKLNLALAHNTRCNARRHVPETD